jgi:nicotinamide-nucleotide amidase
VVATKHLELAESVVESYRRRGLKIATAESCTGGLISGILTGVPGASWVFDRGFVTYANSAKTAMLGVPEDLILGCGAVSEEVARAMAEGALATADVDAAIAVTGIAGPEGGSTDKPIGLVHIALARKDKESLHERHLFKGDREAVRDATVEAALRLLMRLA